MDYFTLRRHVAELGTELAERPVVTRAYNGPGRTFALRLKRRDSWGDLIFSLDSPGQGLRFAENGIESETSSSLVKTLNRLLTNGRIAGINLAGEEKNGQFDRVVKLHFVVIDSFFGHRSDFFMFCEFTGRIADIFICDADLKIIDRFSRTSNNLIGALYRLPESKGLLCPAQTGDPRLATALAAPPETWKDKIGGMSPQFAAELAFRSVGISVEERLASLGEMIAEASDSRSIAVYLKNEKLKAISCFYLRHLASTPGYEFTTVNAALNWLEESRIAPGRFAEAKKRAVMALQRDLRQKNELLEEQHRLLQKFADADQYKNLGDLLVANLYQIKPGSREVELQNWQTGELIKISLDPIRTPAANAARFFNMYKKARRGTAEVEKRIEALGGEIAWLREQIWLAENAATEVDLPIAEKKSSHRKGAGKNTKESPGRKNRANMIKPDVVIDGCRYYIGRNARQNDMLTFQVARRNDWWFHANDVPGAHVILKKPEGEVTEEDLYRGAALAAWFSFAREGGKVPVDTTEVANVKRIPGGMPGRVSYTYQRTIMVDPAQAQSLLAIVGAA